MREILQEVDLEYLAERDGAMTEEVPWDDILSLGEKQRLAIARLVHHKPRFAILDECSSAITSEMEQRLYRICKENEITCAFRTMELLTTKPRLTAMRPLAMSADITIAHRPVLRAYHDISLAIGDGKQGWTLEKIDRSVIANRALQMAKASVIAAEDAESIKNHAAKRSEPYAHMKEREPMPSRANLPRLLRLIKLAAPDYWVLKLASVVGLIFMQTW